ncbi:MAG: hypothetical protein WDZ46_05365 [Solirubrobacterales bacterium]
MTQTKKFRLSPAMVIACIALFATTAGTALAAALPKNSVRSAQIVNGAVKTVDLGKNAVKSGKIADGTIGAADLGTDSVGTDEIAKDAVDSDEIAKDAVESDEIADNAVGSAKVADQSLTANDLAPNSVGSSELQTASVRSAELGPIIQVTNTTAIANGGSGGVSVQCPAGTTVISGGAQPANFGVEMTSTLRSGNGWLYQAKNNSGAGSTLRVFAYCLAA